MLLNLLNEQIRNIRRYASSTVLSLACVAENTVRLTSFRRGLILDQLSYILAHDNVEEIRINAANCLYNCASYSTDMETVELMAQHRDLLQSLATAVKSDYSADVRAYAAR